VGYLLSVILCKAVIVSLPFQLQQLYATIPVIASIILAVTHLLSTLLAHHRTKSSDIRFVSCYLVCKVVVDILPTLRHSPYT